MAEESDIQEQPLLDFSGGLNTTLDQTLIKDNELKAASNVFYDLHGAVEKRYGYSNLASNPFAATAKARFFHLYNSLIATDATNIYIGTSWNKAMYTDTTATFTNGSAVVARSTGTAEWTTQLAAGEQVSADGGTTFYTILSVDNNSQITLTAVFAESTVTTTLYARQKLAGNSLYPYADAVGFDSFVVIGPANDPASGTSGLLKISTDFTDHAPALLTTTRRITSAPKLNIMAVHKNYVFGCYSFSTTIPSRVFWCALADIDTWPASNFVDVAPNDSGVVRGMVSYNDVLYIFKDNDIYYLTGEAFDPSNPTYALRKIVNPHRVGTLNGLTIRVFENKILFLGRDNIYAIENGINIVPFGTNKLRTTVLNNVVPNNNNLFDQSACAEIFDSKYWLACRSASNSGDNAMVLTLDKTGAWAQHDLSVNAIVADLQKQNLYLWDNSIPKANTINLSSLTTNDGSAAISSSLESRVLGFGDFTKTTLIHDIYVAFKNADNQAATISLYDDSGLISTTAMTFTGGSTKAFNVQRIPVERDTNGFYFKISDATASKTFLFLGAVIVYSKDARGSGSVIT